MVKSVKAIILVSVMVSMSVMLINSCGVSSPTASTGNTGVSGPLAAQITPAALTLNPASKSPLPPVLADPVISALPAASIPAILKEPHANPNASSPNKKPFNQLCGYYYEFAHFHRGPETGWTDKDTGGRQFVISSGLLTYDFSAISNTPTGYDFWGRYYPGNSLPLNPPLRAFFIDCGLFPPDFMLPDDFFTGSGFPDGIYIIGGIMYEKGTDPVTGNPTVNPPVSVPVDPKTGQLLYPPGYYPPAGGTNPPATQPPGANNPPPPGPTLSSITINPSAYTLPVASDAVFTATANYSDGSSTPVNATWGVSNTAIATVTGGVVVGLAQGTTTITAMYGGQTGTAALTVTPETPSQVIITPLTATIAQGETQQFIATAIYTGGRSLDITTDTNTRWLTGRADIAVIDPLTGIATGKSPGTANIAVSYNNKPYPFVVLTVGPPKTTLTITPNPAYLNNWGSIVSFTATATYSDPAIPPMDMTNGVSWSCNTYGINQYFNSRNTFELQTYNNGTTTVYATSIVADRYSGKFLTASATLIYGDPNKNPCGLTYVPYDQYDAKWAVPYDNYPPFTIADKGCLLTCYAMIFATKGLKINGQIVDPINLNQWLIDKGGYDTGNIDSNIIKLFPNAPSSPPFNTTNPSDLDAALTNCRPVIVKVSSCRTGHDHFVVVLRKNGDDYDIIDPYKFAKTKLSAYTVNNTYGDKKIHQIISF